MTLTDRDLMDLRVELVRAHNQRPASPIRLVGQQETSAAQARPDVRAALVSLADLPDDLWFAFERLPDGTLAKGGISVADVRRDLMDGSCRVDIAAIPNSAALMRWALRDAPRDIVQ
ncbi:MAG: hypothetical protein ACRDQU_12545 [Pseudonocardiaceae bacterium]